MITGNSSQLFYHPASTTLVLDVNSSIVTPACPPGLFPQRIRKIHQTDMQKKNKTLKMLQNLELIELAKNQYKTQHLVFVNKDSTKKNRISSYLVYKRDHELFKNQHATKVSHLKGKFRQKGLSFTKQSPFCYRSQTLSPRNQERVSNSKLNMVKIELTDKNLKQEDKVSKKQRKIYIKTSEGKRQKVNPADYQNKILSKFSRSQSKAKKEEVYFNFNEFSKTQFISDKDNNFSIKNTNCILRRKIKLQNRNSNCLIHSNEKVIDCRPWTSNKSEFDV